HSRRDPRDQGNRGNIRATLCQSPRVGLAVAERKCTFRSVAGTSRRSHHRRSCPVSFVCLFRRANSRAGGKSSVAVAVAPAEFIACLLDRRRQRRSSSFVVLKNVIDGSTRIVAVEVNSLRREV